MEYEQSEAPTFSSGAIVPIAQTVRVRQAGSAERTENDAGAPVRMDSAGHHLVLEADFKLKSGTTFPTLGATLTASNGWKWLVTGEPVCTGMVGKLPAVVRLELEYWPAAQGYL